MSKLTALHVLVYPHSVESKCLYMSRSGLVPQFSLRPHHTAAEVGGQYSGRRADGRDGSLTSLAGRSKVAARMTALDRIAAAGQKVGASGRPSPYPSPREQRGEGTLASYHHPNAPIAASTPPPRCGTPAARIASSVVASAPSTMGSLRSPKWPMRMTRPASGPSPPPSDKL
jgi:hypothetical protein